MWFELHGVELILINDKDLYYWYDKSGERKIKNPYWRRKKIYLDKTNNYLKTNINNKEFKFHRIVYFAHNIKWNIYDNSDDNMIDHRDENKLNNHISNLRVFNKSQNRRNSGVYRNAKGYTKTKYGKYQASITINGKRKPLGNFDTEEEAHEVYLKKRNEIYKD